MLSSRRWERKLQLSPSSSRSWERSNHTIKPVSTLHELKDGSEEQLSTDHLWERVGPTAGGGGCLGAGPLHEFTS